MPKNRLLLWLLVFFAGAPACQKAPQGPTGTNAPVAAPSAEAPSAPAPFLWEVVGPNGPSYLLGTMHLGVDAEKELDPAVWDAFSAAERLIVEVDIQNVNPAELQQFSLLPAGQKLSDLLGEEPWKKLVALLPTMPPDVLALMRPWVVNSLLVAQYLPPTTSMDLVLLTRMREAKKDVVFLETLRQQAEILADVITVDSLKKNLSEDNPEAELKKATDELSKTYKSGDATALEKLLLESDDVKNNPEYKERLLFGRNQAWLPTLEEQVKEGGAFVAVGAAHLIGAEGLVALLKGKGYEVKRVPAKEARSAWRSPKRKLAALAW